MDWLTRTEAACQSSRPTQFLESGFAHWRFGTGKVQGRRVAQGPTGKVFSEHLSVPQQGIDKFLNGEGGYGYIKSDSGGRDIFVN
jgi:hypothetical protein